MTSLKFAKVARPYTRLSIGLYNTVSHQSPAISRDRDPAPKEKGHAERHTPGYHGSCPGRREMESTVSGVSPSGPLRGMVWIADCCPAIGSRPNQCDPLAPSLPSQALHWSIRPRSLAAAPVCSELDEQVRLVYSDGRRKPRRAHQPAISKGVLDAHLAIAQAPSETSGANCASRDSQWRPPRALVRSGHVASSST